jgi:large repetitive protein
MTRKTKQHQRGRNQHAAASAPWLRRVTQFVPQLLRFDTGSSSAVGIWNSLFGVRRGKLQFRRRDFSYRSALVGVEALEYRRVLANTVSITTLQNGTETPGSTNAVAFLITQQATAPGTTIITFNLSGSATEGSDYPTIPHSVQIQPGTTSTTLSIPITDDRLIEGTESIVVQLQTASNPVDPTVAVGTQNTASASITDNDTATVALLGGGGVSVTEGGGSSSVQVQLTLNSTGSGIEQLAVPVSANLPGNADYTPTAAVFSPGATTGATSTITVSAVDDQLVEAAVETFGSEALQASSAASVAAVGTQSVSVVDNDSATVAIATGATSVTEGGASSSINAFLTLVTSGNVGPAQLAVPISVGIAGNSDFSVSPAIFGTGSGSGAIASIGVTAVDDLLVEPATVSYPNLPLGIVDGGGSKVSVSPVSGVETVQVTDNDIAIVTIPTQTVFLAEGGGSASVTATLTLSASGGAGGVPQLTTPITVSLPVNSDFTANSITFPAGSGNSATDNFIVTAVDDQLVEATTEIFPNQTLTPTSSASVLVGGALTVRVTDNDMATVAINSGSTTVTEGGGSVNVPVQIILQTSGVAGSVQQLAVPISVNLPGNADYTATPATFPIGTASGAIANISVSAVDDQIVEPPLETFPNQALVLTSTGGASVTIAPTSGVQQIGVLDNDTATVSVAATANGNEQGAVSGVFTVTQTNPSSVDTVLNYSVGGTATSGSDYTPLSGSVTIPAGATSATITVPVIDDTQPEPTETVSVTLTGIAAGNTNVVLDPSPANRTATLSILDNDIGTTIDLADASDSGASNTDNITNVTTPTLTGAAPPNASIVVFDSSTVIGSTTANSSGVWSLVSTPLADGVHSLTAQSNIGATVATSPVLTITIDTQITTPTIGGISPDNGSSSSDGITNVGSFMIIGTAEKNSLVTVFQGGLNIGSVVADDTGIWKFNFAGPLANGSSVFYSARATDVAGNLSAFSTPFNVQVDTVPPPTPSTPDLTDASDHGISNTDNLTNVVTPAFTSNGEVGSTITLFDSGTPVGSGVVNSAGLATIVTSTLADGPHTITAQAVDVAGNLSGFSGPITVTIQSTPPSISVLDLPDSNDSGISNNDNITNVNKPTLVGTATPGVTVDLLNGATVIATTNASAAGNFQFTLSTLADGVYNLRARASDAAGNQAASPILTLTIDTKPPATPPTPILAASSDSGASNSDQITKITSVQLSGTAEPGSTAFVFDGAALVDLEPVDATGNWHGTANLTGDGQHSITVRANDAAGNLSPSSAPLVIRVDTAAPAQPIISGINPDTGSSSTDGITSATSFAINGTAEANSSIIVFDGAVQAGTAVTNAAGAWTLNIVGPLAPGSTHPYTATATDLAGNTSTLSLVFQVVISNSAPNKPAITGISTDAGRSATDGITNDQTLTVIGTSDANVTITVFDGALSLGTTTSNNSGAWAFVDTRTLADGSKHNYTATASDAAGNPSAPSAVFVAQIDVTPPTAPVIWAIVTDVKSPADMVDCDNMDMDGTGDPTPNLSGVAEANSLVKISDGATVLGTVLTDVTGNWSFADTRTVINNPQYTATATDVAGNTSAVSAVFSPVIDRTAPNAPTITGISPDTGTSSSDGITSATKLVVSGTAEANALVSVFEDATVLGAVTADNNGNWSFNDPRTLADGTHNYSALASDQSGNTSFRSTIFVVTVDTKPPGAPSRPDLTDASDSGASHTDNLTNVTTPTFVGTAEANSTVRLLEGGKVLGTATASSAGNWTITSSTLADGVHNIAAQAVDAAGNIGPVSQALAVTIDTVNPTIALFAQQPVADVVGDTDGDSDCDLQDLLNVMNNFGKSGLGDTNGDGVVDAQDRANVVNHFGQNVSAAGGGAIAQTAAIQVDSAPIAAAPITVETQGALVISVAIPAEQLSPPSLQNAPELTSSEVRPVSQHKDSVIEPKFVAVVLPQTIGDDAKSWNSAAAGANSGTDWEGLNSPADRFSSTEAAPAVDGFFEQLQFETADAKGPRSFVAQDNAAFDLNLDNYYAAMADHADKLETPSTTASIAG